MVTFREKGVVSVFVSDRKYAGKATVQMMMTTIMAAYIFVIAELFPVFFMN